MGQITELPKGATIREMFEPAMRIERLFKCAHPVFGPISAGAPTAEEAFEAGRRMASDDTE